MATHKAREKMRIARLGTRHSSETIKKISEAQKRRHAEAKRARAQPEKR